MAKQQTVFIALGSNIAPRDSYLTQALLALEKLGSLQKRSNIYETASLIPRQRHYLNQVVQLKTKLSPTELLTELKKFEKQLGRKKREHWAEREIDLDILLYGDEVIWQPDLQIPHAELSHRRFVLVPLTEIASEFTHPVLGFRVRELLQYTPTNLTIRKWKN